jgi:hypothetical protein
MTDPELAVPTEIIDALPVHQEGAQETAKQAKEWLITKRQQRGYRAVDRNERVKVVQAFAAHNKVVYGQAFDLVRISAGADPKFFDLDDLTAAVARKEIILIEVKASRIERTGSGQFGGHFFSISTAELLVAQSLGDLFKFAFVNTKTEEAYEVSLQQIYRRAKAIYPTWSIRLDDRDFSADSAILA